MTAAVALWPFVLVFTAAIVILGAVGSLCQAVHDVRVKRRQGE